MYEERQEETWNLKNPNLLQSPVILPIPYTPPTLGSGPCAFLSHANPCDWGVLQD